MVHAIMMSSVTELKFQAKQLTTKPGPPTDSGPVPSPTPGGKKGLPPMDAKNAQQTDEILNSILPPRYNLIEPQKCIYMFCSCLTTISLIESGRKEGSCGCSRFQAHQQLDSMSSIFRGNSIVDCSSAKREKQASVLSGENYIRNVSVSNSYSNHCNVRARIKKKQLNFL